MNILISKHNFYEYKIIIHGKYHSFYFLNKNDFREALKMNEQEWVELILEKNKIIHCCILNEELDEYLMDITDYIKNFVYYFNEDKYLDVTYMIPDKFPYRKENVCVYLNTETYEKKYMFDKSLLNVR